MLMGVIEGGAYELLTIYSGILGVNELAANTVISNLCFVVYMVPLGIAMAATSLIGGELGEGNHRNARMFYRSTYLLAVLTAVPIILLFASASESITQLYTSNAEIITKIVPALLPV